MDIKTVVTQNWCYNKIKHTRKIEKESEAIVEVALKNLAK